MPKLNDVYQVPPELHLGRKPNNHVSLGDQTRQLAEVKEILGRLRTQPGVILADEVGTGKTFVALSIAYSVAMRNPRGPVIVMVPPNLVDKWAQDLSSFCELYLEARHPEKCGGPKDEKLTAPGAVRWGEARNSSELMKLLDDAPRYRCHLIFLAQGALARRQTDKWIRLALIAEALRRHARGQASRLIQVKRQIHRFLAELISAIGEQKDQDLGEELWQRLLGAAPETWMGIYNGGIHNDQRALPDDPVPISVVRALRRVDSQGSHCVDLRELAEALKDMPVRARGGPEGVTKRLKAVRSKLLEVQDRLWKDVLVHACWRSPLLVMDEAHHLKNPGTALARQLQSTDSDEDLKTGDGALAKTFDRMLFLTATPFQLGHAELVNVLMRFGDVRWEKKEFGEREALVARLKELGARLDGCQRSAISLQKAWSRLRPEDAPTEGDVDVWWQELRKATGESVTAGQRAVVDAFGIASGARDAAQEALRPWIIRYNKGAVWPDTPIPRRDRVEGAAIEGRGESGGLTVPPQQLLPFFLAARSAVNPARDLLGEALCSSFEAFRFTRKDRKAGKDEEDEPETVSEELSQAGWYLEEFDRTLEACASSPHPKVTATVKKVVDLWEEGEKVLVFGFYRKTCRALRVQISQEIERRMLETARQRLNAGADLSAEALGRLVARIQDKFFDDSTSPGRKALDEALDSLLRDHAAALTAKGTSSEQSGELADVMRRFLRVGTTLVRCFPLAQIDSIKPQEAVDSLLDYADASRLSWREKFHSFLDFLTSQCSEADRPHYIDAARKTQTRGIRVSAGDGEDPGVDTGTGTVTLANIQEATGDTPREARPRLMRAFNTPFFPDILVCSEVMGEGVDLQRFCRHVIHHDLAWNPSTIEQRTGRVDRLGCKALGRHPIMVFLPFLSGAADERQFRVMADRERWFRVLMGQDEVARLITADASSVVPLPTAIADELGFKLSVDAAKE